MAESPVDGSRGGLTANMRRGLEGCKNDELI